MQITQYRTNTYTGEQEPATVVLTDNDRIRVTRKIWMGSTISTVHDYTTTVAEARENGWFSSNQGTVSVSIKSLDWPELDDLRFRNNRVIGHLREQMPDDLQGM